MDSNDEDYTRENITRFLYPDEEDEEEVCYDMTLPEITI